ncbi:hypothetical protein FRB90_001358, partial [Tulasnella sp. 427]
MSALSQPSHSLKTSHSSQSVRNTSTSQPNTSSSSRQSSTLTVEAALAQADGDVQLALKNVVNERNMLSQQNAQLWKLFERQRLVMKEYERSNKAAELAASSSSSRSGHRTAEGSNGAIDHGSRNASASGAKIRSSPSVPQASKSVSMDDTAIDSTSARPRPSRHQSDHTADQRSSSPQIRPPELQRAQEINGKAGSEQSSTPRSASRRPDDRPSLDTSVPIPQVSLSSPPTSASPPSSSLLPPFAPNTGEASSGSTSHNPPASLTPDASPFQPRPRASARESRISLPDEASRYIQSMVDSPAPSPRGAVYAPSQLSLQSEPPTSRGHDAMGNRPSRTQTPPIHESHKLDPQPEEALVTSDIAETDDDANRMSSPQADDMYDESIISVSSRRNTVDESPFEDAQDFYQDAETGSDEEYEAQTTATPIAAPIRGNSPSPPPLLPSSSHSSAPSPSDVLQRPPPMSREPSDRSIPSQGSAPSVSSQPLHTARQAVDTDVPDSPSTTAASNTTSSYATSSTRIQPPGFAQPSPSLAQPQVTLPGQTPGSQASFPPPTNVTQGTKGPQFKSTRLTVNDLPYTVVRIQGSNIKANDRGKEVLSFLFMVYPSGDGELSTNPLRRREGPPDSWLVEKLYSEILALDSKIRPKLGKGYSKKLAPLPDQKLFKDHAPAKADARKASLETYMQSLVAISLKDKMEICMFLSTDVVKGAAVMNPDHKEGYLTKRGKNFGGWKKRYFVLQSPVLEYFENRGGQHLGSIQINGAQIGRQQRNGNSRDSDDENSYRHAFLIIEAKKGPAGTSVRHVLCAESDEERDAWVELLVKYVVAGQTGGRIGGSQEDDPVSRHSTSEGMTSGSYPNREHTRTSTDPQPRWGLARRDEVPKPSLESFSESASVSSTSGIAPPTDAQIARRLLERNGASPDVSVSTSLPNNLDQSGSSVSNPPPRANSELGHYSDGTAGSGSAGAPDHRASPPINAPGGGQSVARSRSSFHPARVIAGTPPDLRAASPEKDMKQKISGPIAGAPIPAGAKFGGEGHSNNDRERKVKSRGFWGFGKAAPGPAGGLLPRAVFGVPLEVSLSVAQIADLPAIVFRCIEYLQAKNAEQEEGIYRLSGSSNVIKSLKERFNMGTYSVALLVQTIDEFYPEGDVNLLKIDEFWDLHAVAGLLKTFLRDLPTSVLTRELHVRFLGVIDLANHDERVDELASLVSQLPVPNYCLLRALTAHLILVVQHAHINKMTMRNVGIVFSPTLGIPAGVFSLMMGEFERVFNVNVTGTDALRSPESGPLQDGVISNRNSRSYADGAADKLLGFSGITLRATDEESDDVDEDIAAESSDTETENDTQEATSPPETPGPNTYTRERANSDTESSRQPHSANVAAQRGLTVSIAAASNGRRTSGLPASPRPRA